MLLADALVLHPLPRWPEGSRTEKARPGPPPQPEAVPGPPLTIRFPGARSVEGEGLVATLHHFLLGSGFTRNVPGFERVLYRDVVPGIDVVVRAGRQGFAYDLHVSPGAGLDALVLEIEGAHDAALAGGDVLALQTSAGRVEMLIGAAWEIDTPSGATCAIASSFRMLDADAGRLRVGFEAPGRDPARAFVLDPSLAYATYVGGSGQEDFIDMDVAPDGSVYLAARSFGGPTTPGAFQEVPPGGGSDAWAGKLSPDGSTLEWATYLGGSDVEVLIGIDVDQDGTVVLVGDTWSANFPVTAGVLDTTNDGAPNTSDLFVTRLAPDGSSLVWSTFYGGPDYEVIENSTLFPSGDVLVFAKPGAATPPATPGAFDTIFNPFDDHFLARISADGTQLVFQTYFAGSAYGFAFDNESNIYFSGGMGFPGTPGAYKEMLAPGDPGDMAVMKMDPMGTYLHWATFLGGDEDIENPAGGIALDAAGAVYVAGWTKSDDFPVTTEAPGGNNINGFVAKLLPGGSDLVWSTYLSACCGGSTFLSGIAVDPAGNAFVSGDSNRAGFPVTPDALQPNYIGSGTAPDGHLTKLDAFGEALVYSTYFGGSGGEYLPLVGLDATHDVHLAMQTTSSNLPVTQGAYDPAYSGGGDMFVAEFTGIPVAPWRVLGGGVKGSLDTPNLAGAGALTPGSPTRLSVRGGAPSAAAMLVVHLPALGLPLTSGLTLTPTGMAMVPLATNEEGALDLTFAWPAFSPGLRLTVQVWIEGLALDSS